jgi:hypothetical protein
MDRLNKQTTLFKLWDDWRALIKLRAQADPGSHERQVLDKRYNRTLPLVAMITDVKYRENIDELAIVAIQILEQKDGQDDKSEFIE